MSDIKNIEVSGNSYPIKALTIVDRRGQAEGSLKFWSGTRDEYEALAEAEALDDTMLYNISNDPNSPLAPVNVNELITSLNNKADKDLSNTSPALSFAEAMKLSGIRTVIDSHIEDDGSAWYRLWSDGWCEEGGLIKSIAVKTTTLVLLSKEYSKVLNVSATCKGAATTTNLSIATVTPTNISIYYNGNVATDIYWQVYGFVR